MNVSGFPFWYRSLWSSGSGTVPRSRKAAARHDIDTADDIILMVVIGTMMTRFLPFLLFPAGKPTPKYIQYLGKVLPSAVFGLRVVYCLKDVSVLTAVTGCRN